MRRYETIFILDPDLSDEGRVPVFDRLKDLIPGQGGTLLDMDEWGSKRLAYEIKKRVRGYYVRADYCGSGNVVDEMERFFRIDDRVLKYMTVLLDEDADVESLKAEFEKIASEKEAAKSSAKAAAQTPDKVAGEKEVAKSSATAVAQTPDKVAGEEAVAESSEIDAAQTPDKVVGEEAVAESSEIAAAQTPDGEPDSVDDDNGKGSEEAPESGDPTGEDVKEGTSETENNKEA